MVKLDELEAKSGVTLITRGGDESVAMIRGAVQRAMRPNQVLSWIEEYRLREEEGVVHRDPYGDAYDEPRSLSGDREYVSVRALQGRVLHELVRVVSPPTILELGTAYGVSALYLLAASPGAQLVTV